MEWMRRKLSILLCLVLLYGVLLPDTPFVAAAFSQEESGGPSMMATPDSEEPEVPSVAATPEPEAPEAVATPEPEAPEEPKTPPAAATTEPEPTESTLESGGLYAEAELPEKTATPVHNSSIMGMLWIDKDLNGAYNNGESPAVDYPVYLYRKGDLANAIQSATTNSNGHYSFENLPSGTYVVAIGAATVNGQEYVLFPGGRKSENHFALMDGWESAEDEIVATSGDLTVESNTIIFAINGCVCLPPSPVPMSLTLKFTADLLVLDADGIPAEGIKWEIGKHIILGQTVVEYQVVHRAETDVDGIIWYQATDSISVTGYDLSYTIFIYFPSTVEMVHAKGTYRYKYPSSSNFSTIGIDRDYPLSSSKYVSWGFRDQDTGGQGIAEYHLGGPVVINIYGYSQAPTVVTGPASNITQNQATVKGTYDFGKASAVAAGCYFEYGTAPDLTGALMAAWMPAGTAGTASANLTGLQPGTTYYYRIRAENGKGAKAGEIASFKTLREVTVRFDMQDGSSVQSVLYLETDAFQSSNTWDAFYANPKRPTYVFAGWNTKTDGTGTTVAGGNLVGNIFTGVSGTLYAQWKPQEYEITVQYRSRDGGGVPGAADYQVTQAHGTAFTPVLPTLTGYVLVDWTLNGTAQAEAAPNITVPTSNTVMTLLYGYDRTGNGVEDFVVTKKHEALDGTTVYEESVVIVDVGSRFMDPALDMAGYVYDHYEIDGTPSAVGATPDFLITAARGDLNICYLYKTCITIRLGSMRLVYGDGDPNLEEWLLSVEGPLLDTRFEYGIDYTLSISEDPAGYPCRSTGSFAVIMTLTNHMLDKLKNYSFTIVDGMLIVEKRPAQLTAMPVSKTFDGISYGYHTFTLPDRTPPVIYGHDALPPGQKVFSVTVGNQEFINAGAYPGAIDIKNVILQDEDGNDVTSNYTLTFTPGDLTILRQSIRLEINSGTKVYGGEDPIFSASIYYESITYDELLEYTLYRDPGENVGTYAIRADLEVNPNYLVAVAKGELEITPKGNGDHQPGEGGVEHFYGTINIDPQTKIVGEEDPILTCTASFEGLVGQDELSFRLVREAGEIIGTYSITVEWEDSYPTKNYDVTAVKIIGNVLTVEGTLGWGILDSGMNGMELDFGEQRLPMGVTYYQSRAANHTLRIVDSRAMSTSWHVDIGLTKFVGDDGSSFAGEIILKRPSYEQGGLNVGDTFTVVSDGGHERVLTAEDDLGNGVFDITWNGADVTLYIDETEAVAVKPAAYMAQMIWVISDAP